MENLSPVIKQIAQRSGDRKDAKSASSEQGGLKMELQTLEFLAFFLSYLLVGLGFLWVSIAEPLLRFRADFEAQRHFLRNGVPPLDV